MKPGSTWSRQGTNKRTNSGLLQRTTDHRSQEDQEDARSYSSSHSLTGGESSTLNVSRIKLSKPATFCLFCRMHNNLFSWGEYSCAGKPTEPYYTWIMLWRIEPNQPKTGCNRWSGGSYPTPPIHRTFLPVIFFCFPFWKGSCAVMNMVTWSDWMLRSKGKSVKSLQISGEGVFWIGFAVVASAYSSGESTSKGCGTPPPSPTCCRGQWLRTSSCMELASFLDFGCLQFVDSVVKNVVDIPLCLIVFIVAQQLS